MPDFISRNGTEWTCSKSEFHRRNDLPYGKWTCADGREVLFNRFYEPIFDRKPGMPVIQANPAEWIGYRKMEHFYQDATPEREKVRKAEAALKAFMGNAAPA